MSRFCRTCYNQLPEPDEPPVWRGWWPCISTFTPYTAAIEADHLLNHPTISPRPKLPRFRYIADPICLLAVSMYALNRFVLRPHHWGGWIAHDYLNDLLCLPLFVPATLLLQRLLGLRRHDQFPRLWEIAHHWVIYSVLFEIILPHYPQSFRTTADPWDAVAYGLGGMVAYGYWQIGSTRPLLQTPTLKEQQKPPPATGDLA